MDEIHVMGKCSLSGEIFIQGSKNAALPMMAASLMHRGRSVLKGCPRISDVFCMEEVLKSLGAVTWWEDHDLYLDCSDADGTEIPETYTRRMRSSIILLGPVLSRNKKCRIGYPGGCIIGKRPIDLHLMALGTLGADISEQTFYLDAECSRFQGKDIYFTKSSVGATQQAILAAVMAQGVTKLHNCAKEPEVFWLCRYLRSMGALIKGEETKEIMITGIRELGPGNYTIPPDRIVAGTYLCAAAATRSEITLRNVPEQELQAFLEVYQKIGGQYTRKSGTLVADSKNVQHAVPYVETEEYPGFPTDLQSLYLAAAMTLEGKSCICENVFEDRLRTAEELQKMGGTLQICGKWLTAEKSRLHGAEVVSQDLRGGAALVSAALAAEGFSTIRQTELIERGYERFPETLRELGAKIIVEKEI